MTKGRIFGTTIHSTREESIEAESNDMSTTKIFTDGSGFEGGAGAAAVIYQNGSPTPTSSLKYHLGKLKDHSTYEGEAVGLILAAWLIRLYCKNKIGTEGISIYTDCQSVIDSVYDMKPGPSQYLLNEFHALIASFTNLGNNPSKFTINWISVHSQVNGNEQVDKEAKEAAQGISTPKIFLPPLLQCPLPTGKSALLQQAKETRTVKWRALWETSPRNKRMKKIDKDFPYTKFGKLTNKLMRKQTSILIQMRTGHLPLNDYLYKRKLAQLPNCNACLGGHKETLEHLLKECIAYKEQRKNLRKVLRERSLADFSTMLSDPKRARLIVKFVEGTKHWTNGYMRNPDQQI